MRIHVALVGTSRNRVKLQLQTRAEPSQEPVSSRLKTLSVLFDPVFKSISNLFSCLSPAPPPLRCLHTVRSSLASFCSTVVPLSPACVLQQRSPLTSQKNPVEYDKSPCLQYQPPYEIKVWRAVGFLSLLDDEAPLRSSAGVEVLVETEQSGKRGMEIHGPYRGAVMVEQRVRSPQHLCGRLMTAEKDGQKRRKAGKEASELRPAPPLPGTY